MSRRFDKMTDAGPVDTNGKLIDKCIEEIWHDFSSHPCGRKLKGDDEFPHLCGLHVSAIRRRRAKDAARREKIQAQGQKREAFQQRVDAVAGPLGLTDVRIYANDERVDLPIEQLEALAERIAKLRQSIVDYAGIMPEGEEP